MLIGNIGKIFKAVATGVKTVVEKFKDDDVKTNSKQAQNVEDDQMVLEIKDTNSASSEKQSVKEAIEEGILKKQIEVDQGKLVEASASLKKYYKEINEQYKSGAITYEQAQEKSQNADKAMKKIKMGFEAKITDQQLALQGKILKRQSDVDYAVFKEAIQLHAQAYQKAEKQAEEDYQNAVEQIKKYNLPADEEQKRLDETKEIFEAQKEKLHNSILERAVALKESFDEIIKENEN